MGPLMYLLSAEAFVIAIHGYFVVGTLAAVLFVIVGLERIGSEAKESGVGFRVIIFPGLVALWPLLLPRAIVLPESQKDPHR
jgi:hypothetical protein